MKLSSRLVLLLVPSILILRSGAVCFADEALTSLSEAEKRGGWKLLFDGKTTNGWRNYRADKMSDGWAVKDGVLDRVSKAAGDIVTTDEYENFELSLEYRISKGEIFLDARAGHDFVVQRDHARAGGLDFGHGAGKGVAQTFDHLKQR